MPKGSLRRIIPVGAVLLGLIGPASAPAPASNLEDAPEGGELEVSETPVIEDGPPAVPLQNLLQLPSRSSYGIERRGGLTQGEWKASFEEVEELLAAEQSALAEAEQRIAEAAGESAPWQVAPPVPGAQNSEENTLDFKTRQEIRRRRAEIERLEERLQKLEIQADLANVPESWR